VETSHGLTQLSYIVFDDNRPVCYFKTCIKISVYSFEMRESYSKKSIKPCWSEIWQICQGKKSRKYI